MTETKQACKRSSKVSQTRSTTTMKLYAEVSARLHPIVTWNNTLPLLSDSFTFICKIELTFHCYLGYVSRVF